MNAKIKARYTQQLCAARKRNIEWLFTFETWWKMWEESGQWSNRGRKSGQYCMARKGDTGPYGPDNVDIVLINVNAADANKNKTPWNKGKTLPPEIREKIRQAVKDRGPRSEETKEKLRKHNTGRPWTDARRQAYLASKV